MSRGWARLLLIPLLGGLGCDLTVHPFAGTVIQMSVSGITTESAPGTHLELWARDKYNDILRIDGINSSGAGSSFGIMVRKAITMSDPCMINEKGDLLVTAAAYPGSTTIAGVTQAPDQQAAQVRNRIGQVTSATECNPDKFCGGQGTQLLAVLPFDATAPPHTCAPQETTPCMPWNMPAADRLAACRAYWADPLAYTPNPAQLTLPANGTIYGFIAFNTAAPPANYDGIRIDSPTNLRGLKEFFLTSETPPAGMDVNPNQRGPVFLDGFPDYGGREVVHFELQGPTSASGTAAMLVNVDQDPVQF